MPLTVRIKAIKAYNHNPMKCRAYENSPVKQEERKVQWIVFTIPHQAAPAAALDL